MNRTKQHNGGAHKFCLLLSLALLMISFAGCRKVSHNGAIDGNWQILSIENRATGEFETVDNPRFYAIGLHVVNLTYGHTQGSGKTANMVYDKENKVITLDFPYTDLNSDPNTLSPWGIYTNPVTLTVLEANRSSLVLQTPETIITCRKF